MGTQGLQHNNSFPLQNSSHNFQNYPSLPNNNNNDVGRKYSYPMIPNVDALNSTSSKKAIVRLIDFNNWKDGEGQIDEASLKGVRGLIQHLKEQLAYKN